MIVKWHRWAALAWCAAAGALHAAEPTLDELKRKAQAGDAAAEVQLGGRYDNGLGVKQDYAEAARWYEVAAKAGNALAQNNLGSCARAKPRADSALRVRSPRSKSPAQHG